MGRKKRYTQQNMTGWVNIDPNPECPECLCFMWERDATKPYDKANPHIIYYKCPTCGYIDNIDNLNFIYDDDVVGDAPLHCLACCGPYPSCCDECDEFYEYSHRWESPSDEEYCGEISDNRINQPMFNSKSTSKKPSMKNYHNTDEPKPRCPECGEEMWPKNVKTAKDVDQYKCTFCGFKADGNDVDWGDYFNGEKPPCCVACGGPWPSCETSCEIFDD